MKEKDTDLTIEKGREMLKRAAAREVDLPKPEVLFPNRKKVTKDQSDD